MSDTMDLATVEDQGTAGRAALPAAPWQREPTAMDLIREALARGTDLETVKELRALAVEMDRWQARKAFNEAFAAFKTEAVTILRNRRVTDGPLKGKSYAELVSFVDAATPALAKHGLSASWEITRDEKDWIEVTCVVEHHLGGSKRVSLGGPPDTGGAKNVLQARVSTVTYLERVTFKAACGLAEQGDDDDGRGGKKEPVEIAFIDEKQVAEIQRRIVETGADLRAFLKFFGVERVDDLPAKRYDEAVRALARKAALAAKKEEEPA